MLLVLTPFLAWSAPISFTRDLAPVLVQQCQSCHGPKKAKGKYRVDSFEHLMKVEADELLYRIQTDDEDERMPPKGDGITGKDLILAIIGTIGTAGSTGHTMEYRSAAVRGLSTMA